MDIVLSYARKDQWSVDLTKPIFRRLQLEAVIRFFQDIESLAPGESWSEQISEAIEKCSAVICFLSNHYFASSFIQQEELPRIERRFTQAFQFFLSLLVLAF
jgi:hypothetical protein